MFAIVRVRGRVGLKKEIERTLKMLRLNKKNHCVVVPSNKNFMGMVNKVQGLITWGEIDAETLNQLITKRGRIVGNKRVTEEYIKEKTGKTLPEVSKGIVDSTIKIKEIPGLKQTFRLKPPTKGFERKGIKKPYSLGGALGYRGKKINDLLKKMI